MKNIKSMVCSIAIGLILIAQLMSPVLAYADGEITPTPTDTVMATSTPEPTDLPTEIITTDTPTPDSLTTDLSAPTSEASPSPTEASVETGTPLSPTDTPEVTVTDLIETTVVPVEVDTSTPEPPIEIIETIVPTLDPAETAIPADVDIAEQPTLLEAVQEVPGDTNIVVLDENGQPLSLASQAAADVIAISDPMWCPDGTPPGFSGCTYSYSTMTDLLYYEGAYINSQNVNGTIWITSGYVPDVSSIVIDGSAYTNWANYSLTLQGGWSGYYGDTNIGANSIFYAPIGIYNWNSNLAVNNITVNYADAYGGYAMTLQQNVEANTTITNTAIENNYSSGLNISNFGTVNIDNTTISGNYGNGADIGWANINITNSQIDKNYGYGLHVISNNSSSIIDNVSISNSTFNGNWAHGADISAANNITLDNSVFSENDGNGLTVLQAGSVTITNGTFNNNYYHGVYIINTVGNITLANITATANPDTYGDGAYLDNTSGEGNVVLTGTNDFSNHNQSNSGVYIISNGDVTLGDITANDNGNGVNISRANNVAVTDGIFNNNFYNGIYAVNIAGNIDLTNITATANTQSGSYLFSGGNVNLVNSTFTRNAWYGAEITSTGDVMIGGSAFIYNNSSGLFTDVNSATITNSDFSGNEWHGADITSVGDVTIDGSSFSGNYINGANIFSTGDVATLENSTFENNGYFGLSADVNNAAISNSSFSGNDTGAGITFIGNVTIDGSIFSGNNWAGAYITSTDGDVTINGSTFSSNGDGLGLYADVNNGTITNSIFSRNDTGADITSTGDVSINGGTFTQNFIGAVISPNGQVNISESDFSSNGYDGLRVFANGGAIGIQSSTFNNNNHIGCDGYGAWLLGAGSVMVGYSTFSQNFAGLVYNSLNNIQIINSGFQSNYLGIGYDTNNNINLSTDSFFGNTHNTLDMSTLIYSEDCFPSAPLVANLVQLSVQNQDTFVLDCAGDRTDGYSRNLPNGDLVEIFCPVSGVAKISRLDSTTLPDNLPDGYTYASAFSLDITQEGNSIPVIREGGYVKSSFIAQPLQQGHTYSILYWDNETRTWITLKDFMIDEDGNALTFSLGPDAPDDSKMILSGVRLIPRYKTSRVEVTTNFPGTFVLAQY